MNYTVKLYCTLYDKDQSSVSKRQHEKVTSEKGEMVTCKDNTQVAKNMSI